MRDTAAAFGRIHPEVEQHAEQLLEQLIVPHPSEELVGYVPVQVGEDER